MPSPDSVFEVIEILHRATQVGTIKWSKTDNPNAYALARPQGSVVVGLVEEPDELGFVAFFNTSGETEFHFQESPVDSDPLDQPVRQLAHAAADSASEVAEAMSRWLSDLRAVDPNVF